jgi:hypothetical protein
LIIPELLIPDSKSIKIKEHIIYIIIIYIIYIIFIIFRLEIITIIFFIDILKGLDITVIDQAVDFYTVSLELFNLCSADFRNTGTAPMNGSNTIYTLVLIHF